VNPRLRVTAFATLATLLGSLSLLPIYDTFGWIPRVLLVVLAIAATSALVQRVRALAVAAPLAMALVWAGLLTLLYAHSVAPLGVIPGPAALRLLHQTLSSGFTDTTQLSAPVPVTRGLSLMTTGGIGLVAIVVETLASCMRRPAVAGLPLLAIFTVPAAIASDGVGWQPFVFAAAGYLALLLAEGRDRISRWGRPVRAGRASAKPAAGEYGRPPASPWAPNRSRPAAPARTMTTQLTQVGRRVGFTAITIAVIVPVIIPGLHSGWFGNHHTAGTGGLSNNSRGSTSISPIVTVRQDLNEPTPRSLLTYTTTGTPTYLRLMTLDRFDGTQWTVSSTTSPSDTKIDKSIPQQAGVTIKPVGSAETDIVVTGLRESYLPVPVAPTSVKAHGDWRYNPVNAAIYAKHSTTIHLSYKVTNSVYDPSQAFLNSVPSASGTDAMQPYLDAPRDLPAQIRVTADQIIADARAGTPYEKALALQAWFQAGTYDITIKSGSDDNALLTFVRDRRGYCEQFAATMALMARLEGIPARVDVGFTPGTKVSGTDTYQVTTADAHAWPELYFAGAGWLRFEPTPRSDGQTTSPAYANTRALPAPAASGVATGQPRPIGNLPTGRPDVPNTTAKGGIHTGSGTHIPVGWLIAPGVLVLAIFVAPAVRWSTRRRRWTAADTEAARAHAAWDELGDDLRDLRLDWRGDRDTPRRAAATLVATRRLTYDTAAQQALARLTRAEELARYAARPDELRWLDQDPRADEATVRRALFSSVSRGRRVRARLAPSSTSRMAVSAAAWLADSSRAASQSAQRWIQAKVPGARAKDVDPDRPADNQ
jgi:transglutaminase-like putative cysteine protease